MFKIKSFVSFGFSIFTYTNTYTNTYINDIFDIAQHINDIYKFMKMNKQKVCVKNK